MPKIEEVILFQIEQVNKISKQYSQREFDKMGIKITIDQWIILKIISEYDQLTQRELATKSYRDPASITRTLDLLAKKNYVQRNAIPNNRRTYHIALTNEGTSFIDKHMVLINQHREKSIEGFSTNQLELLSTMLKKIRLNMS